MNGSKTYEWVDRLAKKIGPPVEIEGEHVAENVVFVGPVPRLPPEEVAAPLASQVNLPGPAGQIQQNCT